MIIGIGCDIVEFNIVEKFQWESDIKFLSKVFSSREIETYSKNKKVRYLAGRFAVKEAVLKSLGTGMYDGIYLKDIEIIKLETGQPTIELSGEIKRISQNAGVNKWFVSISHSSNNSIAYVIAEN